jgi:hypothetical protein
VESNVAGTGATTRDGQKKQQTARDAADYEPGDLGEAIYLTRRNGLFPGT